MKYRGGSASAARCPVSFKALFRDDDVARGFCRVESLLRGDTSAVEAYVYSVRLRVRSKKNIDLFPRKLGQSLLM